MTGRKAHVRVPQAAYLEAAGALGAQPVDVYATRFGVSSVTARRNLDGLVAQGLLERRPNGKHARTYAPAAALQSDVLAGLRAAVARLEALERELAL
jgi:DNA-binding IclR family transcriptional regulator